MNTKTQGAFVLLGSILLSCTLTYILTKAKFTKQPARAAADIPAEQKQPENKPPKQMKNGEEIPLQNTQKIDITKYAEKYVRQNAEAMIREYAPEPKPDTPNIEIIDEDIFDSNSAYEGITFTLYSDGTLTDEQNHIVEDPENSVGTYTVERFNALEHNGAVYVRNHETNTDFEILRDLRSYDEAVGGYSHANRT